MSMEKAIKKAREGGYNVGPIEVDMICDNKHAHYFIDPLFWFSLGKAMGWEQSVMLRETSVRIGKKTFLEAVDYVYEWELQWVHFIDHLVNKKPIDDFFNELIK